MFCERGGIEGEKNAKAVANAIRQRAADLILTFKVKTLTCKDVKGTLLVLIAAGLVNYVITYDDEEEEHALLIELATRPGIFVMQDDDAWNVIPSRYFRE